MKDDLINIWQQVPPDYYQKGITKNPLQWLWHNLKIRSFKKLTQGLQFSTCLDVGCAGGYMSNKISMIFPGVKVTGLDVYPAAVNFAKVKYPHINFLATDAHNLPFNKNTFDLIVCYETIEHVLEPKKILEEIKRVMTKEGYAIIAMDSGNLLFRVIWPFWENTFGRVWQGAHLHPFHHNDLEKIIREAGFKISKKHFSHLGMEVSFMLKKTVNTGTLPYIK